MKDKPCKVQIQKGERLNPDMKTMKTMNQEEKLAEKHERVKSWKSAGKLTTHVPKK